MKHFFSRSKAHEPNRTSSDDQIDASKKRGTDAEPYNAYENRLEPLQFADIPWDLDAPKPQLRAVPARVAGSSLPPAATSARQSPVEELDCIYTLGQPQATASTGNLSNAHGPKMVVFAPSPEKQRARHRPALLSDRSNFMPYANDHGSSSSFARPTIASQARAKPVARASLDTTQRDRSTYSRPGALSTSSRRSYSYNAAPSQHESHMLSVPRRTSDVYGGRLSLDLHANAASSIRSNSPLNLPRRVSAPMQTTSSNSSARKSSLLPPFDSDDTVTFPATGNAPHSFGFPTWSDMTQQDLVRNLSPRERTRQEVLWEIVASEERYVLELEKARELYIDALLDPGAVEPQRLHHSSPQSKHSPRTQCEKAGASASELPIAAKYMGTSEESSPSIGHDADTQTSPAGFHSETAGATERTRNPLNYGLGLGLGTTATRSTVGHTNGLVPTLGPSAKAQKNRPRPQVSLDSHALRLAVPLPPSLHEVLSSMCNGLLEAHETLCDALKARYEEQWPLVRSLADIFMTHSHMLAHYATYVCHLQRAMGEVEEAALMERAFRGKKLRKERLSNTVGLGRTLAALEARAAEQGCAGLSIMLSLPFQRLLKYPLLFQNLLYHTDPSTLEFESTVAMVVEVERLVRSIEDEKVSVEERDKTRDAFARIDGITNKQVLRPKRDRVLVEERPLYDEDQRRSVSETRAKEAPDASNASDSESGAESGAGATRRGLRATLRTKRSYRRLSDFLGGEDSVGAASKAPSMGSKNDLWLVRFSDMELRCQRVGVTALPLASTAVLASPQESAEGEASDFAARSKESRLRLKALRSTTLRAKTRNLYKFIAVTVWRSASVRDEAVSANDAAHAAHASPGDLVEEHEPSDDEQDDADERSSVCSSGSSSSSGSSEKGSQPADAAAYIRSTKLSFTYWGDRIEPNTSARRGIADQQAGGTAPQQRAVSAGRISSSAYRSDGRRSVSAVVNHRKLDESMAATSLSTASESMQNVVAQMHARPRNDKFGARLRPSLDPPSTIPLPKAHHTSSAQL